MNLKTELKGLVLMSSLALSTNILFAADQANEFSAAAKLDASVIQYQNSRESLNRVRTIEADLVQSLYALNQARESIRGEIYKTLDPFNTKGGQLLGTLRDAKIAEARVNEDAAGRLAVLSAGLTKAISLGKALDEKTQSDYVAAVVSAYEGPMAILTLTDKLIQINAQVLAKIVSEPASGEDYTASEAGKSVADLTAKIEAEIEKLDNAEGKAIAAGIKTARASKALRGSLATATSLNTGAKGAVAKISKQHNEILGLNNQVFALSKQVSDLNLQVAENQTLIKHLNLQLADAEKRYTDAETSLNRTATELVDVKKKLEAAPTAEELAALEGRLAALQSDAKALAREASVWYSRDSALVKKHLGK